VSLRTGPGQVERHNLRLHEQPAGGGNHAGCRGLLQSIGERGEFSPVPKRNYPRAEFRTAVCVRISKPDASISARSAPGRWLVYPEGGVWYGPGLQRMSMELIGISHSRRGKPVHSVLIIPDSLLNSHHATKRLGGNMIRTRGQTRGWADEAHS